MKVKMNKHLTEKFYESQVKEDIETFKAVYTEHDLSDMFFGEFQKADMYTWKDIYKCDVEAFPSGYLTGNYTSFNVHMILEMRSDLYKLDFYMSLSGEINTSDQMLVNFERYVRV